MHVGFWEDLKVNFDIDTIPHRFSREIEGVDPCPEDFLLNMSYYLQFGRSSRGRGSQDTLVCIL